jgi:sec-independent protein translocase protein TatA
MHLTDPSAYAANMGNFRGWEWILILLLALLLFGGFKKLPDAARGIGRSLRIFKAETKGLQDDDEQPTDTNTSESADADSSSQPSALDAGEGTKSAESAEKPVAEPHPVSPIPGSGANTRGSGTSDSPAS